MGGGPRRHGATWTSPWVVGGHHPPAGVQALPEPGRRPGKGGPVGVVARVGVAFPAQARAEPRQRGGASFCGRGLPGQAIGTDLQVEGGVGGVSARGAWPPRAFRVLGTYPAAGHVWAGGGPELQNQEPVLGLTAVLGAVVQAVGPGFLGLKRGRRTGEEVGPCGEPCGEGGRGGRLRGPLTCSSFPSGVRQSDCRHCPQHCPATCVYWKPWGRRGGEG